MIGKIVEKVTVAYAIEMYKRYRHDRALLLNEKRYVMEFFWKHIEKEKENSMRFQDWLFDYVFSSFEVENAKEKESQA